MATSGTRAARASVTSRLRGSLLLAVEVALDLDEAARAAEDAPRADRGPAARRPRRRPPARRASGPRAPPVRHTSPAAYGSRSSSASAAGALRRAELHPRDQAAKVLIALAVLHEERQARAVGQRELAADDRLHARVRGGASQAAAAPYTPSRSTSAMAGMSSRAASATNASGCSAPSRNENADCACSSMNTVSRRGRRDTSGRRGGRGTSAAERAVAEHHVPLVARPRLGHPTTRPTPARAPRTRRRAALPRARGARPPPRPPRAAPAASAAARAALTPRHGADRSVGHGSAAHDLATMRRSGSVGGENASIVKASERCESTSTGEPRLSAPTRAARRASTVIRSRASGRGRLPEPSLPGPSPDRMGADRDARHGSGRRMGLEVENDQGEHRLDLAHRVRERDVPRMVPAGGEAEPELERVGGERGRLEPPAEPLQHGLEHDLPGRRASRSPIRAPVLLPRTAAASRDGMDRGRARAPDRERGAPPAPGAWRGLREAARPARRESARPIGRGSRRDPGRGRAPMMGAFASVARSRPGGITVTAARPVHRRHPRGGAARREPDTRR